MKNKLPIIALIGFALTAATLMAVLLLSLQLLLVTQSQSSLQLALQL